MSSANGVLKITKRSLRKFQFSEEETIIPLDVIEIADQWHEVNFALRTLEGDMWVLPASKVNEYAVNRLNFVQAIVNEAYAKLEKQPPVLSRIEAEEFIQLINKEVEELRNFTSSKDVKTSFVPENTDREVVFSQ